MGKPTPCISPIAQGTHPGCSAAVPLAIVPSRRGRPFRRHRIGAPQRPLRRAGQPEEGQSVGVQALPETPAR